MGTNTPQAGKRRSFNLRSFRKSSAGERQEVARNADEKARTAEEAVRAQKAAAWQWHTHGVGDAVVPTKRPSVGNSQAPSDDKNGVGRRSKGGESNACNVPPKTTEEPRLAESPRAASRFKAEACFSQPKASFARPTPGDPSTPLYDELELSGLRTHMADFVQRLQHPLTKDNAQSPAVGEHHQSQPPSFTSAPSVSIDRQQSKVPRPVAAASSTNHQLTTPPSSAAPVSSITPLHTRPFSALHRLFRKVVSGSITKSTKNSPRAVDPSPALYEPEVLIPDDQNDDMTQYHYHHYIHHHHHHYHYARSPNQKPATIINSQRRHSESGGILPHIPNLWEVESDEEEGEAEESAMEAHLLRRRRYSDSFPRPKKAGADVEDEALKEEHAKAASPMQFSRRYNSERFSPNKIPMVSKEIVQPAAGRKDEFDEGLAGTRSRRHFVEHYQEEASLDRTGGKSAGGSYKFGRAAGGGKPAMQVGRWRHSESSSKLRSKESQYERGKLTPSPLARYYLDALERRHIGLPAPGNAAPLSCHAALPPLYPQ